MTFQGLWVDDQYDMPEQLIDQGWNRAYNAWEALTKLELIQFEQISLSYYLVSHIGNNSITSYDMIIWLAKRKDNGLFIPQMIYIHNADEHQQSTLRAAINQFLS